MVTTYADVSDADFSDLGSTHFYISSSIKVDDMDRLGSGLGHRLNNHVVLSIFMNHIVEEAELPTIMPNEYILERVFANLAF